MLDPRTRESKGDCPRANRINRASTRRQHPMEEASPTVLLWTIPLSTVGVNASFWTCIHAS